jgi:hypothetical protein
MTENGPSGSQFALVAAVFLHFSLASRQLIAEFETTLAHDERMPFVAGEGISHTGDSIGQPALRSSEFAPTASVS